MSQNLNEKLTKCLIDMFIFLEFSGAEIVNGLEAGIRA
jgi:hypothetical protein